MYQCHHYVVHVIIYLSVARPCCRHDRVLPGTYLLANNSVQPRHLQIGCVRCVCVCVCALVSNDAVCQPRARATKCNRLVSTQKHAGRGGGASTIHLVMNK